MELLSLFLISSGLIYRDIFKFQSHSSLEQSGVDVQSYENQPTTRVPFDEDARS